MRTNNKKKYTIFNIKEENHPILFPIRTYGIFSEGLKNKFKTAMVNKPSVFEPLVYCTCTFCPIRCRVRSTLFTNANFMGNLALMG